MVVCPECGVSPKAEGFCPRCGATRSDGHTPAPRVCPLPPDGPLHLSADQAANLTRPDRYAQVRAPAGWYRVHWLRAAELRAWAPRVARRLAADGPALAPCRTVEDTAGLWVVADAAPPATLPWTLRPARDPLAECRRLLAFLKPLAEALESLHRAGLVCLTFRPSAIEILEDRSCRRVRFTNLDVHVHPAGDRPDGAEPDPHFAAPEVWRGRGQSIGPRTDVFHLALFAYCWLARLLPDGIPGAGLPTFEYDLPPLRVYYPALPVGLWEPLRRGLALDPGTRFPTPGALCAELEQAVDRAVLRAAAAAPVAFEVGATCRVGPVKAAAGRVNEDHILVREFGSPPRALVVVADGISTCDVGSGAIASQTTCEVLAEQLGPDASLRQFPDRVTAACHTAGNRLLRWALEQGHRDRLAAGDDLMGTTLTAAWVEGNEVIVANLGDSQAHLIDEAGAEQLTVDGNVATAMLAAGAPPEQVRNAGSTGRALREFVGGSALDGDGEPVTHPRSCTPALQRWKLLPGDVLVLCSDGLVEEGLFLEPQELGSLVTKHAGLSAESLATLLADMAEARQGVPRPGAPKGYGDNVSCVVIKIL